MRAGVVGKANSGRAYATPGGHEAISSEGIKLVVVSVHNSPWRSCETCQMVVVAAASESPPAPSGHASCYRGFHRMETKSS